MSVAYGMNSGLGGLCAVPSSSPGGFVQGSVMLGSYSGCCR